MCDFMQKCVHGNFSKCFKAWAWVVNKCTCLVFILTIAMYVYLSMDVVRYSEMSFDDERYAWMPKDNPSIKKKEFADEVWNEDGNIDYEITDTSAADRDEEEEGTEEGAEADGKENKEEDKGAPKEQEDTSRFVIMIFEAIPQGDNFYGEIITKDAF